MKNNLEEIVADRASDYIISNWLGGEPRNRRLRIIVDKASLHSMANALTQKLNEYFIVRYLSDNTDESKLAIDEGRATGIRNETNSSGQNFILLLDGSIDIDSVGAATFDEVSINKIYTEILKQEIKNSEGKEALQKILSESESAKGQFISAHAKLKFAIRLNSGITSVQGLGRFFDEIGLINDHGEDYAERLQSNSHAVTSMYSKANPIAIAERLKKARVVQGDFFDQLKLFFEHSVLTGEFDKWTSQMPEEFSFDQWPILSRSPIELLNLNVTPFVDGRGNLTKGTHLRVNEETGALQAQDKVKVSWTTNPSSVGELGKWRIEVIPAVDLEVEFPILKTQFVASSLRSVLVKFDLSEEDYESLAPRYQLRITALDEDLLEVDFAPGSENAGQVASAHSQEFQITSPDTEIVSGGDSSQIQDSINHAVMSQVMKGSTSNHRGLVSIDGDFAVVNIAGINKVRIPFSPLVANTQSFLVDNPNKAYTFKGGSLTGQVIKFTDLYTEELDFPDELIEARSTFLAQLARNEHARQVEFASFDDELSDALANYSEIYFRLLEMNVEHRESLLALDCIHLTIQTASGEVGGIVLLPTHPIRANWIAQHTAKVTNWSNELIKVSGAKNRKKIYDHSLFLEISSRNLPFSLFSERFGVPEVHSYLGEVSYGVGLYSNASEFEPNFLLDSFKRVLFNDSVERQRHPSSKIVESKLKRYADSHNTDGGVSIISIHSGEGSLVSDSLMGVVLDSESGEISKVQVRGFADSWKFLNPLESYESLYQASSAVAKNAGHTFLTDVLQVSAHPMSELELKAIDAHVAVVEGISKSQACLVSKQVIQTSSALSGLITRTQSYSIENNGEWRFFTAPSISSLMPSAPDELSSWHRSFLKAIAKSAWDDSEGSVGIELIVDTNVVNRFSLVHEYADWVITVDPHVGLGVFEIILQKAIEGGFVLDYSPDFVDGVGERITVSSSKNMELVRVIQSAMQFLGILPQGIDPKYLLESLSLASGQLALRLLKKDSKSTESIGLAVTMAYLRLKNELSNKVIIPVDSHLNLFGVPARNDEESGQRCDLLIVEFGEADYTVNFVEVKARSGEPERTLPAVMWSQIEQTYLLLKDRVFDNPDGGRLDHELQWARWCGLLRFYAERGHLRGQIETEQYHRILSRVDSIESHHENPVIEKTGYIVAVGVSPASVPSSHGDMALKVLNSAALRPVGFTTVLDSQLRVERDDSTEGEGTTQTDEAVHVSNTTEDSVEDTLEHSPPETEDFISKGDRTEPTRSFVDVVLGIEVENE